MQEITSKENQYIKLAQALQQKKKRREEARFLLEGRLLIEEAFKRGINVQQLFFKNESVLEGLEIPGSCEKFKVSDEILEKISTTDSPAPLVAIAEIIDYDDEILGVDTEANQLNLSFPSSKKQEGGNIYVYCENIQDPGNLGSIIRSSFAAGVKSIFLNTGSVDIYNPKVLRSSMGAAFSGPIKYVDLDTLIKKLKANAEQTKTSLEIIGTSSHADSNYNEISLNPLKNILLVVGNEAHGMSQESINLCTHLVKIPMANEVESINVLAATSVILFELNQQK